MKHKFQLESWSSLLSSNAGEKKLFLRYIDDDPVSNDEVRYIRMLHQAALVIESDPECAGKYPFPLASNMFETISEWLGGREYYDKKNQASLYSGISKLFNYILRQSIVVANLQQKDTYTLWSCFHINYDLFNFSEEEKLNAGDSQDVDNIIKRLENEKDFSNIILDTLSVSGRYPLQYPALSTDLGLRFAVLAQEFSVRSSENPMRMKNYIY